MKLLQRDGKLHRSGPARSARTLDATAATGGTAAEATQREPGRSVDATAAMTLRPAGTRCAPDGETAAAGGGARETGDRPGARPEERPAGVRETLESGVSRWRGAPLAHGGRPTRPERAADAIAAGEHAEAGNGSQDVRITGRERRHGGCRGDLWWSSRRA